MRFEAVFVAGYAGVLLAAAVGLHRLGRVNSSPWASRLLAAYRRQVPDAPPLDAAVDWPHSEARRLHTGIAVVAAVAALFMVVAESVRHHRPAEALLLGGVAVAALGLLGRLGAALRAPVRAAAGEAVPPRQR